MSTDGDSLELEDGVKHVDEESAYGGKDDEGGDNAALVVILGFSSYSP